MPRQILNIKNFIKEFFIKIKKQKTKLKTIKIINSDLIYFEQKHNRTKSQV